MVKCLALIGKNVGKGGKFYWRKSLLEEDLKFLFEIIERRYDSGSTIYCTQFRKSDWHQRLGGGVHADAIMDRIVHNAVWYDTGQLNMREHKAIN